MILASQRVDDDADADVWCDCEGLVEKNSQMMPSETRIHYREDRYTCDNSFCFSRASFDYLIRQDVNTCGDTLPMFL